MRRFNQLRKACALVLSLAALTLGSAMSVLADEPTKLVSAAEPVLKVSQTLTVTNSAPGSALAVPYVLSVAEGTDTDITQVKVDGNRWGGDISFSLSGSAEKSWKFSFSKPGVYTFLLKQNLSEAEKTANSLYAFDNTVYTIRAYVKNTDNGLFTEITAQKGSDTANKVSAIVFGNTYTKTSSGGGGGGGGGGSTNWHSVTPQGSVMGASRGPVAELIDAVADSPVAQVLGATRKAVQTGDSSMMAVMGVGFVACIAAFGGWCLAYKKRRAEK